MIMSCILIVLSYPSLTFLGQEKALLHYSTIQIIVRFNNSYLLYVIIKPRSNNHLIVKKNICSQKMM